MIHGVLIARHGPPQRIVRNRRGDAQAIVDTGLDFRAFLVVIPCDQLQCSQLLPRVVEIVDCRKRLEPCLAALLAHDPLRSPGCQRVVESFVCGAHGLLVWQWHASPVKALQVAHAIVSGGRHNPGITPITQDMAKATVVLKQKSWLTRKRGAHCFPVDRIRKIDVEICDNRRSTDRHVRFRRKVRSLDILQLVDQSLLRRTTRTGIPLDRSLIDHDCERETGMSFGFSHDQLRCPVDAIVRTVPIDDHTVNTPADHVCDLAVDLLWIGRTVAYLHVVRTSEPQHQVRVDLRLCARIEQAMNVDLADVSGASVSIALSGKAVCRARVVGRLFS